MRGENYNLLSSKLGAFNPLAILKRGYSVTVKLPEGIILKDAASLKVGDTVETKLGRGLHLLWNYRLTHISVNRGH